MVKLILENIPRYSLPKDVLTIEPMSNRSLRLLVWVIVGLSLLIISGFMLAITYIITKENKNGMRKQAVVHLVRDASIAQMEEINAQIYDTTKLNSDLCHSQFTCQLSSKCIPMDLVCNRFLECPDGEDERDCQCIGESELDCTSHRCLSLEFVCDGILDCKNEVDENKDLCETGYHKCIKHGGFWCGVSKKCIDPRMRCDLWYNCGDDDNSDELNCLTLPNEGFPMWTLDGTPFHICTDNWKHFDQVLCERAGFDESIGNVRGTLESHPKSVFHLGSHINTPNSTMKFKSTNTYCKKYLITLKCKKRNCGKKANHSFNPLIFDDQNVQRKGIWPWHAMVANAYEINNMAYITRCGGTLVDRFWILTAAHCLTKLKKSKFDGNGQRMQHERHRHKIKVLLGGIISRGNDGVQVRFPKDVYIHHNFDEHNRNDIALIKLEKPAELNDKVSPPCFISKKKVHRPSRRWCFVTGNGLIFSNGSSADNLQQIRMAIKPCKQYLSGYLRPETFCAVTSIDPFVKNTCMGEGGSPLSCYDEVNERWEVIGLASPQGTKKIKDRCRVGVFVRIDEFESWMRGVMKGNDVI